MEIMAKDFHRHVGKTIMMPHPTMPMQILPVKILIKGVDGKKVILEQVGTGRQMAANYSKDKTKYKVII